VFLALYFYTAKHGVKHFTLTQFLGGEIRISQVERSLCASHRKSHSRDSSQRKKRGNNSPVTYLDDRSSGEKGQGEGPTSS
jgi:hypothetical protein